MRLGEGENSTLKEYSKSELCIRNNWQKLESYFLSGKKISSSFKQQEKKISKHLSQNQFQAKQQTNKRKKNDKRQAKKIHST